MKIASQGITFKKNDLSRDKVLKFSEDFLVAQHLTMLSFPLTCHPCVLDMRMV